MKHIFIRDGEDHPHEIVITNSDGVVAVFGMTDRALLDLCCNISDRQTTAWQRVRRFINITG